MTEFKEHIELYLHTQLKKDLVYALSKALPKLNIADYQYISDLAVKNNFLQILYDYNSKPLQIILQVLEEKQLFENCAIIRDTIFKYNKALGENIKLK